MQNKVALVDRQFKRDQIMCIQKKDFIDQPITEQ